MRCDECGMKECCGASMGVEIARLTAELTVEQAHANVLYAIARAILNDAEQDQLGNWYFSGGLRDRLAFIMQQIKAGGAT